MIQIDSGIPIPPAPPQGRPRGVPGAWLYPWRKMAIGDSFIFPGDLKDAWQRVHSRKRSNAARFEPRRWNGVIRIWRVA